MASFAKRSLSMICYGWQWFLAVGLIWLSQTSTCLAQAQREEKAKNYVPVYMIIMFAVAGALMVICRSSRRYDRSQGF